MGRFDYIPSALDALGVRRYIHKVKQMPGKPFWFGVSAKNVPVFALPGNPLSTQVGVRRYVSEFLEKNLLAGRSETLTVRLKRNISVPTPFTFFVPVAIKPGKNGILYADVQKFQGSGDFALTAGTHGFIEIPPGSNRGKKGKNYKFFTWHSNL